MPVISAPPIRERDIERACTDLLALDGWRCLKTDPCSDRFRGKGFGEKGMADCLYVRYSFISPLNALNPVRVRCEALWIEWKRPRGTVRPHQWAWHQAERARGALTLIAGEDFEPTVDGFLGWYRQSGLMKREGGL